MAEKFDLATLIEPEDPESEKQFVGIIDRALNSSSDPATAAATLVDDLRDFLMTSESESDADGLLWSLWMVYVAVIMIVPIDHPWHQILIDVVEGLRRRGGPVTKVQDKNRLDWEDLPNLRMYLFDKWADPTENDDSEPDDIMAWKRFNSFASRLLTTEFMDWVILPYWMIPLGLETAPQDVVDFECKLWVATEWLINCGPFMYKEMTSNKSQDDEEKENTAPGPLCKEVPGLSLQRWEFWRSRLSELANTMTFTKASGTGGTEQVALGEESLSQVTKAIVSMDAAERTGKEEDKGAGDIDTGALK